MDMKSHRTGGGVFRHGGKRHGHGATDRTGWSHIAVQEWQDGAPVHWMERFDDGQEMAWMEPDEHGSRIITERKAC